MWTRAEGVAMSWIIEDRIAALHAEGRRYGRCEWERFCGDAGITVYYHELPPHLPAFIAGSALVLRAGMSPLATAFWAWHEIAHRLLHAGGREFWLSRPMGRYIVAKQERQANEFAALFPIGDD